MSVPFPIKPLDPAGCLALVNSPRWLDKVDMSGACWLWLGKTQAGYGRIWLDGRSLRAHRVAFVAANGTDIPAGLVLDHLCRTPACVNPDHLEPVSNRTNVLRGNTWCADLASRTHCPRGHALEAENLVPGRLKYGQRTCLKCDRERSSQRRATISAACRVLGLTWRQYTALYGWSQAAAESALSRSNRLLTSDATPPSGVGPGGPSG